MTTREATETLELALTAFEVLRTPAQITAALRAEGLDGLRRRFAGLVDSKIDVQRKAIELADEEIGVVIYGTEDFPSALIHNGKPLMPIIFYKGNKALLYADGIGMCGSRHVTPQGLTAAEKCGATVSSKGLTVVSGYAKGVDTATHLAALRSGGTTVIVLAEGFDHFRVKRDFAKDFDPERTLVLSQFAPGQPWQAHAAMARNSIIYGLSKALLVIEAGERGGTLAAGEGALGIGRPVLVVDFGERTPGGNTILLGRGAQPIRTTNELSDAIDGLPSPSISADPPVLF